MFSRPTLTQLRDQAASDVLIGTGLPSLLRRSPLRALAYALAGLAQGLYGYLDWISRQSVPFTATGAFLEAWAALISITRIPATAATGTVTLTGTGSVPSGTALRRDDGAQYFTLAPATIVNSGIVPIAAMLVGSAGTLVAGSTLTLASPILGFISTGVVANATAGADQELDAPLRTRMLQRYAAPPQGGSATDYLEWTLAVPGVTRAWVNPLGMGAGSVVIYTMLDAAEAAFGGFPQGSDGVAASESRGAVAAGDQLTVANALYPLRPVTALVYSVAPIAYPVPFTIHCAGAVSSDLRTAISAAIDSAFLAFSTPLNAQLETSLFETQIAAVPGVPAFTLLSPAVTITAPLGRLPVRGTVAFV